MRPFFILWYVDSNLQLDGDTNVEIAHVLGPNIVHFSFNTELGGEVVTATDDFTLNKITMESVIRPEGIASHQTSMSLKILSNVQTISGSRHGCHVIPIRIMSKANITANGEMAFPPRINQSVVKCCISAEARITTSMDAKDFGAFRVRVFNSESLLAQSEGHESDHRKHKYFFHFFVRFS